MFGQGLVFGGIAGGAAGIYDVLVIGGGSQGSPWNGNAGSGGGGGAATYQQEITLTAGATYTATVGAGGSGSGTSSSLVGTGFSLSQGGGIRSTNGDVGGASPNFPGGNGTGTFQYGNTYTNGGGGGGTSGPGGSQNVFAQAYPGGTPGAGLDCPITGTVICYAGGARGLGTYAYGNNPSGCGAGAGGSKRSGQAYNSTDAEANKGGGGGPAKIGIGDPKLGGSGVVILKVPNGDYTGNVTGSPTVTEFEGHKIITFTGSGSYTH